MVLLGASYPKFGVERRFIETFSAGDYTDVERQSRTLEHVFAFDLGNRNVSGGDRPERVFTAFVWGDPMAATATRPWLGRGFTREEGLGAAERVAMLRTASGSRDSVETPRSSGGRSRWTGSRWWSWASCRPSCSWWGPTSGCRWARILRPFPAMLASGRSARILASGVPRERANAELATIARRTEQAFGQELEGCVGWRLEAASMAGALTGDYRTAATVLLGAVGLVLLIACANIASLLLARAATRRRALAVRRALGAGRWRLARQLLTESVILAWAGASAGLLVAYGLSGLRSRSSRKRFVTRGCTSRRWLRPRVYPGGGDALGADRRRGPAIQATRGSEAGGLVAEGTRLSVGAGGRRLRQGFVVAELALALVLLASAGLLGRSVARLGSVDPGFDTRDVLTMRLSLPGTKYERKEIAPFFEELRERLTAVPGVRGVAASTQYPPVNWFSTRVRLESDSDAQGAGIRPPTSPTRPAATSAVGLHRSRGARLRRT